MEDYGLVSIICPMYNVSRFINRTIDCVLAQTYQNFELLIVDDISTDDSRDKVLAYDDPRIKLFQNKKNRVKISPYLNFIFSQIKQIK